VRHHLPHYHAYARIAHSKIHGVGVKAIRPIKKGTYMFAGDTVPVIWINKASVKNLPRHLTRLYKDFAISKKGKYGCPPSFNLLTPAWYLNCSKRANVACDANYEFYALRDIKKGEELTIDYDTYSDKE
jgi:SET domain-containing protein